jgi:hypothetical protein
VRLAVGADPSAVIAEAHRAGATQALFVDGDRVSLLAGDGSLAGEVPL